jgi:FixJ family two-component response regulator
MRAERKFGKNDQSLIASQHAQASDAMIAVIDDDESVRKSLARSIHAAGYKVEAFTSAADFLGNVASADVCCVISDLRMPGLDGLQLQELLRSRIPFVSVIFITGYADIPASVKAMKAGAVDFLEKPIRRDMLLEAIDCAVVRTRKFRAEAAEIENLKRQYAQLTPREQQVFVLVSAGLLNKQVAAQLGAAEKTVKQHRGSIMRKIDAESLADLVVMADRIGVRPKAANFAVAKGKLPAAYIQ